MLYNIVLVSAIQQGESAVSIYTSPPSSSPPLPTPPLEVVTEYRLELSVLYSSFPLAIYFTHGYVYVSVLLFWFIPPSPSRTVYKSSLYVCI